MNIRAGYDEFVARHPRLVIAILVLVAFAVTLRLLYESAPGVIYEFF